MLISVQTGGIVDAFGLEKGFDMIAEAGFDGVDINLDHCLTPDEIRQRRHGGFYDRTDEEILAAMRSTREAAEKRGLRFVQAHAPFPTYVRDAAMDEYVLEALKKTIMMCGFLGCPYLIVHPCYLPADKRLTAAEEWDLNIEMYTALLPALKRYGVVCCLENMFTRHRGKVMEASCSDPNEAIRYIDALNEIAGEERYGFCLDIGHATLLGKDLYALIHRLGHRIKTLHVHDNNGLEDEHLFPYMGVTDWNRFCRALNEIKYPYDLNFETFQGIATFDPELAPHLLKLLRATGALFARRIAGEEV